MPESKESEKQMPPDGPCFKILLEDTDQPPEVVNPQARIDWRTEVIRYIKPSTLLLLLAGKVFIPTLAKLQESDRLEALIPSKVWPVNGEQTSILWEYLQDPILDSEEWLLSRADPNKSKTIRKEGEDFDAEYLDFLMKIWLRELSVRRCIWCWNRFEEESYALWSLYGQRGVAIISDLPRIEFSLKPARPFKGLIGSIKYAWPNFSEEIEQLRWPPSETLEAMFSMYSPENFLRPYLFKDSGYRFEREVRCVIAANPQALSEKSGVLIDIDARTLIKDIRVSPQLPGDERRVLEALKMDLLEGKPLSFRFPPTEIQTSAQSLGSSVRPFAPEPGLPKLFSDLDSRWSTSTKPAPEGYIW
jgi:hypothetical protein